MCKISGDVLVILAIIAGVTIYNCVAVVAPVFKQCPQVVEQKK